MPMHRFSPLVAALAEAVLEAHAKRTGIRAVDHGKFVGVEGQDSTDEPIERVLTRRGRGNRPVLSVLRGGWDQHLLR